MANGGRASGAGPGRETEGPGIALNNPRPLSSLRASPSARRAPAAHWQVPSLKEAMRVCQLKVPLAATYSLVYHIVQSSTGSTLMVA